MRYDEYFSIMEPSWCATGFSHAHWNNSGGAKSWVGPKGEEVATGNSALIGFCASAGRLTTEFSATWCAGGREPAGATPDGDESKNTPPNYTKISNSEGQATVTHPSASEPL